MGVAGALSALIVPACGGDGGTASNVSHGGSSGSGASSGSGGGAGDGSAGDAALFDQTSSCTEGQPCDDGGGVCVAGACCAVASACGPACCGAGQLCSFEKCVTPGGTCTDSSECAADEYCEYALGNAPDGGGAGDGGTCVGGAATRTGKCLPKPPICTTSGDAGTGAGDAGAGVTCLEKCEYHPPATAFDPELKYSWGGDTSSAYTTDVMMTPIVVELDDDNCDGKVNADDIPEIAFVTFSGGAYQSSGTLHVTSIVGGKFVDKWSKPDAVGGSSGLAAGDLDGDGVAEIVACLPPPSTTDHNTGVIAYKADGSVLWTQTDTTKVHCGYEYPAIADPDHTGSPEVLVGLTLLDGKTGAVLKELDPATGAGTRLTGFSDIDGDGKLDVVEGRRVFRTDGSVIGIFPRGPTRSRTVITRSATWTGTASRRSWSSAPAGRTRRTCSATTRAARRT